MQWPVDPGPVRPGGAVTTVGKLVWDEMWVLATQFRSGSATTAQRHAGVGGVPANVALAAAQSGVPARMFGFASLGARGEHAAELLSAALPVQLTRCVEQWEVLVLVDPTGERSFLGPAHDGVAPHELHSLDYSWSATASVLLLSGHDLRGPLRNCVLAAARVAHAHGVPVAVDLPDEAVLITHHREIVATIAAIRPEVLFCNAPEAAALFLALQLDEEPLAELTVVHAGTEPTTVRSRHATVMVPVDHPLTDPADTTGCGDAFAGGFLAGWCRGLSVVEAVRLGHHAGATCAARIGANTLSPGMSAQIREASAVQPPQ